MSPQVTEPRGGRDGSSTVRFLNAIRDRWWVIVASGLICASAAFAYSLTETKVYSASSSLLFRNVGLGSTLFDSDLFGPSADPSRDAATNIELLTSLKVAKRVKEELRLSDSPESLLSNVSVEENANSDVVDVSYVSPSAREAARVATGFATAFVEVRRQTDSKVISDVEEQLREEIAALPPEATGERAQLQSGLDSLVALKVIQTGNIEVVDVATVPTSPSAPAPKQNAMLGLVLGLALGSALAFALDFLDRRIRSTDDFEDEYGLPILTRIPHKTVADYDPKRQSATAFEPYRMLRNAIGTLRAEGNPLGVLLVTSAVPEEGKTLVGVNLARAVALTGRDAAIVEADIRDPDLGKHFPIDPRAAKLTTTLLEGTDENSLQRVSPGRWSEAPNLPSGEILLMPAGPPPPNASELLSGSAMSGLLSWLAEMTDMIVLDAPPLLPVADTHALLDQAPIDGCLIVARAESTTRDQVRRTRAILEQHHGLEVIGVVVTDAPEAGAGFGFGNTPQQELLSDDPDGPTATGGQPALPGIYPPPAVPSYGRPWTGNGQAAAPPPGVRYRPDPRNRMSAGSTG